MGLIAQVTRLVNKPAYLLQPKTLLSRLFGENRNPQGIRIVELPWKLPIEVNCAEVIGRTLSHHGIFEISVVESIFRLLDPEDIFLDVGANIGFMSCAALSAGAKKVISFEPHPALFARFTRNLGMWLQVRPEMASRIAMFERAVSAEEGKAVLHVPELEFSTNEGSSSLEAGGDRNGYREVEVATSTLNTIVAGCGPVGMLKIDIEGHELKAFAGGREALQSGKIRDIVYEDHAGMDSEVSTLLSGFGYKICGLNKTLAGPVLLETREAVAHYHARSDECANFLATLDVARARQRMSARGFRCLKTRQAA